MALEQKQMGTAKNVLPKPGAQKKMLTKRKTMFSNSFINPDGSFTSEVSSVPINYKNKSGNWSSINNSLVSKSGDGYSYENAANAFQAKFARNNLEGKLVRIELSPEQWIAFAPMDRFAQQGTVRNSSIYYRGVREGVDLEYILDGESLKEKIILNKPGSNTFNFELSYEGLRLERDENGITWAVDSSSGNKVMHFQKAYAEDAKGRITQNINSELRNIGGKDILIISVDEQWLSEAAFPVVIDPSIIVKEEIIDPGNIYDGYIASGYPTNSYYTSSYLHVGYLAGYNAMRSLIKFAYLPSFPIGAKITKATLNMFMYLGSTSGTTVDVYAIASPWDVAQTNWNNQPSLGSAVLTGFSTTPNTVWEMDITTLVRNWYQGNTPNYGVMLKATNEASPKVSFYSANEPVYTKPKLVINYEVDGLGMESTFSFHDNVNVHNGNLVLSDVDAELPGRGISINVSRTYNLRSELTSAIGYRWTLGVYRRLKFATTDVVYYTDDDGSAMTFMKAPDGGYRSPVGSQDKLYYENNVFYIEDKANIKYYFNTNGSLNRIVDTNNNATTVAYLSDGNIDKITDASGRQVVFGYAGGKLASIGGDAIATVEYTYTGSNLTGVKKKDASGNILAEESYGYDQWNNLITVTDGTGNITSLSYSYTDELGRRVYRIESKLTIDGVLQNLATTYTYAAGTDSIITTVTDSSNKVTEYTTNKMGNILQMVEDKGGKNLTTRYKWDEQQNLVETIEPNGEALLDPDSYRTVMDYNDSGDVTRVINPQNYSTTYDYDAENNPEESVDFGKKPNISDYDPDTQNLRAVSDPLFSTSVMQYDGYGNVISQTNPIGIGDNRIINSGFENWSSGLPTGWTVYNMGGSINDDTEQKVNGDHSVRLESPGNSPTQRTIILSDFIEVKGLVRYNVSWYVKAFNAGVDFGGATADIHWYSERSEASWLGVQTNTVNAAPTVGTTDSFVRKGTQVSSPSNAKYAKVALGVTGGPGNSAAKAWFDNVQFEMGSVINQYNLIYNPDFELDMDANNFPDGWNGANLTALDVLDTSGTRSGAGRCMKIVGSTTAAKSFSQEIRFIGTINTPIRMSGWSRAAGWAAGGTYRMKLEFYSNAVLLGYHTADFPKTDANWHMVDKIVYANGDFDMIKIYGMYENQSGTAWFDDFVVRLAEAPNAIMSAYNITQNGNFEVRDGQNNWPDEWVAFKGPTLGTYSMT